MSAYDSPPSLEIGKTILKHLVDQSYMLDNAGFWATNISANEETALMFLAIAADIYYHQELADCSAMHHQVRELGETVLYVLNKERRTTRVD